jgi:eukaryotic-like serine/threonine-protein kinase
MARPSSARCREIFDRVAQLRPHERVPLIQAACGGDDGVRGDVERLLAAHDALGHFLEVPPFRGEREYARIGGYEVIRKLGEGGMGRVYLAEPGPVAVKVIRRDLDPDLVARRFQREREVLGRLEHPNIARLVEGGTADDGTLYLVLTYVDGVPMDDFCCERALTLRQRIAVFRLVCRAVAFAHEHLIIHRDLKPSNILVTHDGVPVVLDFGLAKLVRTNLGAALDSTRTGHRLLTPEYASPEQVRGLPVTPAVDIYALGVILYELLTGVRPHRFSTWSIPEIVAVVCDTEAAPPSHVRDELRGALDFIVMKAMAKTPASRYSHVAQLDDDLRRYLEGSLIPGVESRTYQS